MSTQQSADVAVIGGGIVGLAHALAAIRKGLRVVLFEREQFAVGASVRNFGLLWPIGQEPGDGLRRAIRSREIWADVAQQAGIWLNPNGSLHLAYHDDERNVLEEFMNLYPGEAYQAELLTKAEAERRGLLNDRVRRENLKGVLWSSSEATVYSREAVRKIPQWLSEQHGLITRFGTLVTSIEMPIIKTSSETWRVDRVFVCSGADFETLYPNVFQAQGFYKCKLQMMKATTATPINLGPSLCAGLTLRHYAAFRNCPSLASVDQRYDTENLEWKTNGVHVLVSQSPYGDWIIGDSHHYGKTLEPFDQEHVNGLILDYLRSFVDTDGMNIVERWNGIYPKSGDNQVQVIEVEPRVYIVNGLGGAGMTLSFGLAEENVG